ncbi:MAG: Undecaprenyl diphosphate synthase (EC 2.5.1.31) [Olavius algarvensis Gamma 3 endosymbiont]|nr:MAG: Undecaprenyl diphosphate synthase (EC 2.5.1.31) [Olavius algarvensis Gamma 3 endosymbiont]
MASHSKSSVPGHVCIIMDGNGRWAKKRLMPRSYGHRKGVDSTRLAVEFFARAGIKHLTLFAFSSENWNRPAEEVSSLMELLVQSLRQYTAELHEKRIRIRFIGDRSSFSADLQQQIQHTENETGANRNMVLNIAANYGGRWDILNASRRLAQQVQAGAIDPADIDDRLFADGLSLGDCPDPDLFIRTGGEQRVSNFLLWQLAYTEFYFCETLWPDFAEPDMTAALAEYSKRQRRYGKTASQIEIPGQC